MNSGPHPIQKLIHRFLMLRPVTASFSPWIHRLDKAILRLTKGRFTVSEFVGWNIIQITTIGAKTGRSRTMPLVGLFDGEKIALIASSYGSEHNPAWYYNLKAHPECKVQWKERTGIYLAHEASGDEYQKYWQLGVSMYAGYEKYKERTHRHIPIMVLKPKK